MPQISICIVNWNARDYLERCLQSIFQNKGNLDIEIWVVDNNSSDGSIEMIKGKFPEVNLIRNKDNIGFARANNQVIRKSNSPYILLLNPDTIVYPGTLKTLANFLDKHSDVAMVGPKILNEDSSIQYECARHFPTVWSEFFVLTTLYKRFPKNKLFGYYLMSYWNHNDRKEVDCISGSCMMIRKDVLDRIGLLDEDFFMYGEDTDLCYRIKQAGYKIWYIPEVKIIHFGGKSTEQAIDLFVREARKSMQRYFEKHYGLKSVVIYRIGVVIAMLSVLAISAIMFFAGSKKSKTRFALIIKKSKASLLWTLNLR